MPYYEGRLPSKGHAREHCSQAARSILQWLRRIAAEPPRVVATTRGSLLAMAARLIRPTDRHHRGYHARENRRPLD